MKRIQRAVASLLEVESRKARSAPGSARRSIRRKVKKRGLAHRWMSTVVMAREQVTSFGSSAVRNVPPIKFLVRNAKAYPFAAAGLALGARYGIGDGIVQLLSGDRWDPSRSLLFASFGATYACTFGYGVYNILYPRFAPKGWPLMLALFDACTNCAFLYFPVYYVFKQFTYESTEEIVKNPMKVVKGGINTWWTSLPTDFKSCTTFWIPMNYLNFWLMPLHLRQPFMSVVGIGWAMILSKNRGARKPANE
mmetsp:Transcript_16406/g.19690  ORF Transcript_16406/g.19690 Transcript_16406/m.19690 type:complete len:251 (-) Transcript_16406:262-1014(-)